jgi:hypothetical protein
VIDHPKELGLHFFSISIQEFIYVCMPFFWDLETSDKLLLLGTQTRGSFFFFFFLCASLMSRLVLDIMLLQKPDVIGILLILIYLLCQKNLTGKSIQDLK